MIEQDLAIAEYHFHYQSGGNRRGQPLLFLHGFMGDCQEFDPILPYFWDDFYCLVIDLPGHGQTEVTGDDSHYGMEKTAIALIDFLNYLQLSKIGLIGYSMGGRLALYLALHFPEKFSYLILESASPGLQSAIARKKRIEHDEQWIKKLKNENFSDVLSEWYQQNLFNSLRKLPNFPDLFARRLNNSPEKLAKSLQYLGTGQQISLWEKLRQGSVPLLLLVGGQDHKFVAINQKIAVDYPQAQLQVFSHCGHNLHLEDSHNFALILRQFLLNQNKS
ncbi:MAG: 2-succinyl-6-hydroxy-2,4-cyclohexadiene-1-carboxylate synthase [Snowella sp.]|nr:MAG: 2-succinyl-6-hydroxy-2,4-cyclohexadiene-1-carboxylate synthase [Snowella sp.]